MPKMSHEAYLCNAYPSLIPEIERLKSLNVPASFTDYMPDTPLADAARRQVRAAGGAS